jgi:hypothetical protein
MVRPARTRGVALVSLALALVASVSSCATTARIDDVYLALDANGDRKRVLYFTDTKEIHCVVEMGIGRPGTTIESLVRQLQAYDFQKDTFFETDRVIANAESSPQPGQGLQKLDVTLKPFGPNGEDAPGSPFPVGRFQCEAYLDGKLEQVAVFNIDFPPCPQAAIKPDSPCDGFYKKNIECPKYGVTSRDPLTCACKVVTGWECKKG